jgi:Domain of unknown function (DUF397)
MNIVTRTPSPPDIDAYYRKRGVTTEELQAGPWYKSSWSSYNGNCVEVMKLAGGQVAVRDTKDKGKGPALIFEREDWDRFLAACKAGGARRLS